MAYKDANFLFADLSELETIEHSELLDVSRVTTMAYMFRALPNLPHWICPHGIPVK